MLQKLQNKTDQSSIPDPSSSIGLSESILMKKTPKVESPTSQSPLVSEKPILAKPQTTTGEPKISAENVRTDLKIKIANVNKTLLDLEMQNITGELSDEDFDDKSRKLESVKNRLEDQLKEISDI